MALVSRFHVLCDLCDESLCWPAGEDTDGQDVMFFRNVIEAEDAATVQGWERIDPSDDHVVSPLRCIGCINRLAAMRAWIRQNRVVGPDDI